MALERKRINHKTSQRLGGDWAMPAMRPNSVPQRRYRGGRAEAGAARTVPTLWAFDRMVMSTLQTSVMASKRSSGGRVVFAPLLIFVVISDVFSVFLLTKPDSMVSRSGVLPFPETVFCGFGSLDSCQ